MHAGDDVSETVVRYADLTTAEVYAYTRRRRLEDIAARRNSLYGKYGPTMYGKRAVAEFVANKSREVVVRVRSIVSSHIIKRLWTAQDGRCYLCGEPMESARGPIPERRTIDHVIPISKGGENHGNVALAHSRCNQAKADRMPVSDELARLAEINARLKAR